MRVRARENICKWFLLTACIQALAAPPTEVVVNLQFDDVDLDAGEIGGPVIWYPPNTANVLQYRIGLATSSSGTAFSQYFAANVGINTVTFPQDTALGSFTHVVVYTANAHGVATVPAATPIIDASASVSGVACADQDLDGLELGGDIVWIPPVDTTNVTYYSIYMATNAIGNGRTHVGTVEVDTVDTIHLPVETPKQIRTHYVVYTRSSFAEQTTPAATPISDTVAPVTSLLFTDQDLDLTQLGGPISWLEPVDDAQVTAYRIYWAQSAIGSVRVPISTVANGTSTVTVPADIPKSSRTHVIVYSESALAEMTTPVPVSIYDRSSSVSSLTFADKDLDLGELGGEITFIAPSDVSQVTFYAVYFASSSAGATRFQIGSDLPVASWLPYVDTNTSKGTSTHLVAYTRSLLAEQTTPVALLIHDSDSSVTSMAFPDGDLDGLELGGTLTWTEPADVAQVVRYNVYFAATIDAAVPVAMGSVPRYTAALVLPENTILYKYLLVFSESSLDEQSTGTSLQVSDSSSLVTGLAFSDFDLDLTHLGGDVTWTSPVDTTAVVKYRCYLATSSIGAGRSIIGSNVAVGINVATIAKNTVFTSKTHVIVYSASSLYEQTTPASIPLVGYDASISGLSFVDLDLDLSDLGGDVEWTPPGDVTKVNFYSVYFSTSSQGASKSLIGANPNGVAVGSNTIAVPGNTPKGLMTHVVVYTRSTLDESSYPVFATLVDNDAQIPSITFPDLDLDLGQLGGNLEWTPPGVTTHVDFYAVYLAAGSASGASRSKLGSDIPVGTNTLTLLADVPLSPYTHFAIFCKSSLTISEQTTPGGTVAIFDKDGTVKSLNFGDRDFDVNEIGGDVKWTPPSDVAQVLHYAVYRATDAAGSGKVQIGSDVAVGTNKVSLSVSTAVGAYTHMVVYSKNSLGEMTTPAATVIADMPGSGAPLIWTISNAESTTPLADGKQSTPTAGFEWSLYEAEFFSDYACSTKLTGTHQTSGQTGKYHGAAEAFDSTTDTAWKAQCAPCLAFEAFLGIEVASVVECVKWLQPPVATGRGSRSVALQIDGTELARATNLVGGTWEGLRYASGAGGWEMIC